MVFDLDETLVRAQRDEFDSGCDSRITVIDPNAQEGRPNRQYFVSINQLLLKVRVKIYIKFRPGLISMLQNL